MELSHELRKPVLTKTDFVRRYAAGEFGNRAPTWNGWPDWSMAHLGANKMQLFHIRNRVAGAKTWYDVPKFKMADKWAEACREFDPSQLYISEMAPTHLTLIQGEIQQSCNHLDLFFSKVRKPMRDSLIEGGTQVSGLRALQILRWYLDAPSLEWVEWLLEVYPGHVIEMSVYERGWGTLGWNTVFWEVRKY